jgi:hypothetical protein
MEKELLGHHSSLDVFVVLSRTVSRTVVTVVKMDLLVDLSYECCTWNPVVGTQGRKKLNEKGNVMKVKKLAQILRLKLGLGYTQK